MFLTIQDLILAHDVFAPIRSKKTCRRMWLEGQIRIFELVPARITGSSYPNLCRHSETQTQTVMEKSM